MAELSIIATAGAVAKLAYGCTVSLYSLISSSRDVDNNIEALYSEADQLRQTATSVETTLQRPELEAFQDAALWTDADASLRACVESLTRFDKTLKGLRSSRGRIR